MPSVMAIVSKAVFEKDARGKSIGDTWPTDRYASQNKALAALAGGDLYLVTVRPPSEALWLVAVLEQPTHVRGVWQAAANEQPIREISHLKSKLRFANGQGLPDRAGTLGMSLQTPRVLVAADLALLGGSPEAVARGPGDAVAPAAPAPVRRTPVVKRRPARPSPTPARPPAAASPAPTGDLLEQAVAKLAAGDPTGALELLVGAWPAHVHGQLAELIATLSAAVRTAPPANLRGKTRTARAAWDAAARTASAADLPMLLESLADVSSGDAAERLVVVETWMPDPRVDAAFVDLLQVVPYRATSTQVFWRKLFPLLQLVEDPNQLARVEALTFDGVATTMKDWLLAQREKLLAVLRPKLEPRRERAPTPILDELDRAIGNTQASRIAELSGVDGLLRAVYETPDDDGPRLVLADALIEREDPRGEFITLQIRIHHDPGDRALRSREKELFDAHGKAWLGDLSPILMADVEFERGFLAACKVRGEKVDHVRKLVGHPMWATVHTLEGSAAIAFDPVMRSLRRLTFSRAQAQGRELIEGAWRELLINTERPLEELRYLHLFHDRTWLDTVEGRRAIDRHDDAEVDALCACATLPRLRSLFIRDSRTLYIDKLAHGSVLDRLERIGFGFDRNNRFDQNREHPLAGFTGFLQRAKVPTVQFEIGSFHETRIELERGAQGYERARIVVGPTMKANWSGQLVDETIRILDGLGSLRELHLGARRWTDPQQVARLRAAAAQLKLEVCEVSWPAG